MKPESPVRRPKRADTRRARQLAASVIMGCIRAGDAWTWRNGAGEEDPELTEALRYVALSLDKNA